MTPHTEPKPKRILTVIFPAGQRPYATHIENRLESFQKIVGGYIDCMDLGRGYSLYLNDEGLINGSPVTRVICGTPIGGDFCVVKHDAEGNTLGLTPDEAAMFLGMP